MKTISLTLAAGLIATSAMAGNSDRYNDLRFDTRIGLFSESQDQETAGAHTSVSPVTISTRNAQTDRPSYPYINPLGVGPHNDSR